MKRHAPFLVVLSFYLIGAMVVLLIGMLLDLLLTGQTEEMSTVAAVFYVVGGAALAVGILFNKRLKARIDRWWND